MSEPARAEPKAVRDLAAALEQVYTSLPREWSAKEGAQTYPSYRFYLSVIAACAAAIARERSSSEPLDLLDVGASLSVIGCSCRVLGMHVTDADDQHSTNHPVYQPLRQRFGVRYVDYDALVDRLPFEDESFDIVNSNDMIEHLHGSPKRFLTESYRALRPGGRIVLTTPNLASLHNRLLLLLGRSVHHSIRDWYHGPEWLRPRYTGHVREFTPGELRYVLREAGFVDVRVRSFNVLPGSVTAPPPDAAQLDYTRGRFSYLGKMPFHDRAFHLRSARDLAYLLVGWVTAPLPGMRRDLVATARKS